MKDMLQQGYTTMIKTKSVRILVLTAIVAVVIVALLSRKRDGGSSTSQSIRRKRPLDESSLKLDTESQKTLLKQYGLRPIKARGATVFVDAEEHIRIPPDNIVNSMEFRDLEETYHRYIETIQVPCRRQVHLGKNEDGGYDICEDPDVVPKMPCNVYSFGVRDDFSFDEKLASDYGCTVHSFDPANGMQDHQHSDSVYFHSMGLGATDTITTDNWKMRTASSIMLELGHEKKDVTLMKIDIEGGEWAALPEMLRTGSLSHVRQLIMEFHSWVDFPPWTIDHRTKDDYRHHLKVFRDLYDAGFRIFYFKRFPAACCLYYDEFDIQRTGCHEIHLMRVKDL